MHRALTVPELLDEIFSYYHSTYGERRGRSRAKRRTLLTLATACSTFQDHAIAALWRRVIGFRRPILCFLRNGAKSPLLPATEDKWDELGWKLCQSISSEDWLRFEKRASHIREIMIGYGDFQGISIFMAFLSVKYLPRGSQGHLFSKLRTLNWKGDHLTEWPFIHLFASPSLRSLAFWFDEKEADISSSLQSTLEYYFPSLTCLKFNEFDFYPRTDEYFTTFTRVIESHSCWKLETFHGDAMDASALHHLSRMPNLKVLTIRIVTYSGGIVSDNGFSKLRSLKISSWSFDPIISLFRSARMPLETIQLEVLREPPTISQSMLQDVIFLIASQPCHGSLTKLTILTDAIPDRFDSTMDNTILRQLFVFCHLYYLRLEAVCTFDLKDDDLIELAAAWPNLNGLVLNYHHGWKHTSAITFTGLASLLRGCPLMDTLSLSMDATRLDFGFLTTPGEDALNHRIHHLNLGDSIIEDPVTVAMILDDLFGSLEQVDAWSGVRHREDERSHYQILWAQVNTVLKALPEGESD
ncbi:hypothetical protein BJ138DRAFT_1089099 [Hygrophoropsis aurantiaca]|uniref:Uncharacterized protein n=1 Tax=Hygrophoropsis aurantiaca TaxID=72124 RepID=A0ACB8A8P1_9AGAM|nr:hypothetical protein BJ138DRAFT_1089099 [Hygrophoropsis aurantiaca]